jgi:uncharacterized FAD-dependent dehydrogenase
LAGIEFQRDIERKAYRLAKNLYEPLTTTVGVFSQTSNPFASVFPEFVTKDIAEALPVFGRTIKGFEAPETILYGPETRSSSPVRITRDEKLQSNVPGVYPAGEGAGYAGGIMSAAVDGIRIAEIIIDSNKAGVVK